MGPPPNTISLAPPPKKWSKEVPLQPQMVQRAYIASSDANLRIVMAAMLLSPFIAQPPGKGRLKHQTAWKCLEHFGTDQSSRFVIFARIKDFNCTCKSRP